MQHQEEYRGHNIAIDTDPRGTRFVWSYQIDLGEIRECRDRPLRTEKLAFAEALSLAKAEIDRGASSN